MFNLIDYFEQVLMLLRVRSGHHCDRIQVGDHIVDLATRSPALRDTFLPALSHLTTESEAPAELTIFYAEGGNTPSALKAPPAHLFNAQGYATTIDQSDIQIFFQPWIKQVFLYSRSRRIGLYWALSPNEVPWWEATFSFRIIFHWWSRDRPLQLMHAGAISDDGKQGWLIPGPSGSGKSTSCLQLLLRGKHYLGDDYVILRTQPPFKIYSLYQTAKINADNFDQRFSNLRRQLSNPLHYHQQKAIIHIAQHYPDRVLKEANLAGILVPHVASPKIENSTTSPVSAAKALMSIAPTTLHHLPHHRAEAFNKIAAVANAAPCYEWQLGANTKLLADSFERVVNIPEPNNA